MSKTQAKFESRKTVPLALSKNRALTGYLIIAIIIGLNIFRACQQSITHDEALTYNWFVSHGLKNVLLNFDSNNHSFHSLLMWITTSIFGLSHLTLRTPALLGGLFYLIASERICHAIYRDWLPYVLTLLALTTSPFILDYLVVARGYGLALGFFMMAFLICWLELQKPNRDEKGEESFLWKYYISSLCALSVASNLSFAFLNTSLLMVVFIWLCLKEHGLSQGALELQKAGKRIISLTVPGAILFIMINPAVFRYDKATMYYGSQSWLITYKNIINALFDNFTPNLAGAVWREHIGELISYLPSFFAAFLLLSAISIFIPRIVRSCAKLPMSYDRLTKLWVLIISVLFITITLHSSANMLSGVLLPLERTSIYFVPLLILLVSISIESFINGVPQRIIRTSGRLGLLLTVIYFLSCFILMST